MNVYEAMKEMRADADLYSIGDALEVLHATADAYDALAPDWANAPDWAQWYAIDCTLFEDGGSDAAFFEHEPVIDSGEWIAETGKVTAAGSFIPLPLGIDWRLCKWQRPEVAA